MRSTLVCLTLSLGTSAAFAQTVALDAWQTFRGVNPYHIQTLALGGPASDGTRGLIVSEPPPHVTLAEFIALSPERLGGAVTKKQKVGFDGWVRDIVVTLPPMSAEDN